MTVNMESMPDIDDPEVLAEEIRRRINRREAARNLLLV